jgi:hypothetical protein
MKADLGDTTRWGGNEMVVVVEEGSYVELRGRIEMHRDQPLENVLVEIFDRPDYLLNKPSPDSHGSAGQKRLAACQTSTDGKFCFRGLPAGKYELRSSINIGWNVTHVYVVVDREAGVRRELHVGMYVGT